MEQWVDGNYSIPANGCKSHLCIYMAINILFITSIKTDYERTLNEGKGY